MSNYSEATLSLSPDAYWRLGEPSGNVAVDQLYGRHGVYNTGVQLGVPGLIGNDSDTAMTATPNAGMIIPPGDPMPEWALKFWAKSGGVNNDFSAYFSQPSDTFDIATFAPGDLRFYDGAGFDSIGVGTGVDPTFWVWQYSAATGLQVYRNAVLVFDDLTRGRALPGGEAYGLGVFGPGAPHDGTIDTFDDTALFPTILSVPQIDYLYGIGTAVPPVRTQFATDTRIAIERLLNEYATDAAIKLQVYRARPRTVVPPTAFIDGMAEVVTNAGTYPIRRRVLTTNVLVLHGLFDSGEAVDQRDAFVDGFMDWVTDHDNVHAINANSTLAVATVEDEPTFTPDWIAQEVQRQYFATRIVLEAEISD